MTEISAKMTEKDRKRQTFSRFPRHSGTPDAGRLFFSAGVCVQNNKRKELMIFSQDKTATINENQQHCFPAAIFPFNVAPPQ